MKLFKALWAFKRTKHLRPTTYHLRIYGQTERFDKTIIVKLQHYGCGSSTRLLNLWTAVFVPGYLQDKYLHEFCTFLSEAFATPPGQKSTTLPGLTTCDNPIDLCKDTNEIKVSHPWSLQGLYLSAKCVNWGRENENGGSNATTPITMGKFSMPHICYRQNICLHYWCFNENPTWKGTGYQALQTTDDRYNGRFRNFTISPGTELIE